MADIVGLEHESGVLLSNKWVLEWENGDGGALRLLCFHWAGGSASFYKRWNDLASESEVQVFGIQLPGREHRSQDSMRGKELTSVAEDFIEDCKAFLEERPMVFFGHGEGAWFAYEVARQLSKNGSRTPLHLIVSNFPSPEVAFSQRPWQQHCDDVSSQTLKNELSERGAPVRLLDDSIIFNDLEERLREDTALVRSYIVSLSSVHALKSPITVFVSRDDCLVGPKKGLLEQIEGWSNFTSHALRSIELFYGDHFYLCDANVGREVAKRALKICEDIVAMLEFDM